jgi:hypothetical protein
MDEKGNITEPEVKELGDFYYHTYEKILTWRKNYYHIIAKTKEEADKAMVDFFNEEDLHTGLENPNDMPLTPRWCDCGDYYEGDEEVISYEMNNFKPTEEIYDDEGNLLDDNTPIEIKRDKKINILLGWQNK